MNIAICDDDVAMIHLMEEESKKILKRRDAEAEFHLFQSGESFITAIKQEEKSMDILLLDIDMPGISGLETAKILREVCKDIILIFISSHDHYVFESLEYRPFRYIRKSRMKTELPLALGAAYSSYKNKMKKYVIAKDGVDKYIIEESEIYYFKTNGRKLDVHLTDGRIINIKNTMKAFYKEVREEDFVKIYEGCVVNMKYIKGYSKDEIILDNGEKLITSREGLKRVKKELARYWGKHV